MAASSFTYIFILIRCRNIFTVTNNIINRMSVRYSFIQYTFLWKLKNSNFCHFTRKYRTGGLYIGNFCFIENSSGKHKIGSDSSKLFIIKSGFEEYNCWVNISGLLYVSIVQWGIEVITGYHVDLRTCTHVHTYLHTHPYTLTYAKYYLYDHNTI